MAITDDLSSGAVAAGIGAPEAAVGRSPPAPTWSRSASLARRPQARGAIRAGGRAGSDPGDRLDEAVARVLELKRKLGLLKRS